MTGDHLAQDGPKRFRGKCAETLRSQVAPMSSHPEGLSGRTATSECRTGIAGTIQECHA
jgi:hypothetical protein